MDLKCNILLTTKSGSLPDLLLKVPKISLEHPRNIWRELYQRWGVKVQRTLVMHTAQGSGLI